MSGGSFNYFCFKDNGEQLKYIEELRGMEQYCREIGNRLAADECFRYLLFLESIQHRLDVYQSRMYGLLHAIEWVASGDSKKEAIERAYNELIEGKTK
jgi:hypothetical protein